jgi:hypothetical protein
MRSMPFRAEPLSLAAGVLIGDPQCRHLAPRQDEGVQVDPGRAPDRPYQEQPLIVKSSSRAQPDAAMASGCRMRE